MLRSCATENKNNKGMSNTSRNLSHLAQNLFYVDFSDETDIIYSCTENLCASCKGLISPKVQDLYLICKNVEISPYQNEL